MRSTLPQLLSSLVTLISLLLVFPIPASAAALLAIDYGTDSFKASLVKPGVAFDVLVTREGRRKTPSLVTMRGEDRSFGGEAANMATRFPQDTFSSVKLLLGHPSSHPHAQLHKSLFSSPTGTTSRNSPSISSSSTSFPVEEVLAMQLTYAKEMADEAAGGDKVRDVVMTVPGWFGQSERAAVLDAIELAGLRSIGLVNDGTAAAVNYAMTRTFPPEPSYHLFYDLGASSLRATLVSLKSALLPDPYSLAAKPELKNVTSLNVHGVGFDVGVGGYQFDRIVRDMMIEEVERKGGAGTGVKDNKRAMVKLLKEAGRVKQVLSANTEAMARIEGLIEDTDFRASFTREQFEARAADYIERFTAPIDEALADAKLTMNDIDSVILVGGSSRVPMVQAAVAAYVGEDKIAKNVNADEAGVLGAALYGAGITRGFRTKDIRVQDVTPYGIDMSYEADKSSEDAEARTITTHLFPAMAKNGVKKTLTFKKTSDFAIHFAHRTSGAHSDSLLPDSILETTITGLSAALENRTAEAIANATVKVTVELNESNMLSVNKAVVVLAEEEKVVEASLNDKLKGLLGKFGSSKDKDSTAANDDNDASSDDADPDAPKVDDPFADLNDTDKEATKAKLEELIRQAGAGSANATIRLEAKTVMLERVPMSADDKTESRKKLREIKAAETRKYQREEARNMLEAFIYRVRDLLENVDFGAASLEHERKLIQEKAEAANEWLWDEAEKATTKELKAKRTEIEKLVKVITTRTTEAVSRPSLISSLTSTIASASSFVASATKNDTAALAQGLLERFTPDELGALTKLSEEAQSWLGDLQGKQAKLKQTDDPVLKSADLERKIKDIENEIAKLGRKKAPKRKKVKATTTTTTTSAAPAEETSSDETAKTTRDEHKKDEL